VPAPPPTIAIKTLSTTASRQLSPFLELAFFLFSFFFKRKWHFAGAGAFEAEHRAP